MPDNNRSLIVTETRFQLPAALLQADAEAAADYATPHVSDSTRRQYDRAWTDFLDWAGARSVDTSLPVPPPAVAAYAAWLADRGVAVVSIGKAVSAIGFMHRLHGHESPREDKTVRAVLRGIAKRNKRPPRQAAPLSTADVRAIVGDMGPSPTLTDLRDRALLLIGYAGALRRSEVAGLDVADLQAHRDGVLVIVRHDKTHGDDGRTVPVNRGQRADTDPVLAVAEWQDAAGLSEGPLFRPIDRHGNIRPMRLTDRAVSEIVKRRVASIGLDADRYSGHSLRAGHITEGTENGAPISALKTSSGHRSDAMLYRYVRTREAFASNGSLHLGL